MVGSTEFYWRIGPRGLEIKFLDDNRAQGQFGNCLTLEGARFISKAHTLIERIITTKGRTVRRCNSRPFNPDLKFWSYNQKWRKHELPRIHIKFGK
ncbi:MAG: hypothetical protein ACI8V2_004711 [Candidatus Latescibacterota bacterium]|jgi:hypothetical protein